jgi:S1-C subfamily serine protease
MVARGALRRAGGFGLGPRMTKRTGCLLALALGLFGCAFVAGIAASRAWTGGFRWLASGAAPEKLQSGVPRSGTLDLARTHEREFELDVDERAVALRVKLVSHRAELDLRASCGDSAFSVPTDSGEATLAIGRFTDPPIAAGRWSFRVGWGSNLPPRTTEDRLENVAFSIEAQVFETRVDGDLPPGSSVEGSIDEESGGFRTFRVEVPPGSRFLRIDLADVTSDLDLYARHGGAVLALTDDVRFAQHPYGCESLLLGDASAPVEAGTWFVDVVDVVEEERPAAFRIFASLAADPPSELLAIPVLGESSRDAPRGAAPVANALSAVVEIATDDAVGSGTILTADGWILTNAHVVERVGGGTFADVVVSASLDPREPPVELFRGTVERVDEDRDFALVHVRTGFYGQPLPDGYRFPTVLIGDPDALAIGDPIWLVGYPSTGGQGSRVTITCTRGVVSGYESADFGPVLKTDAEITTGNSGGAALDERGRIVGVPTSLVEVGSGQVAYVHPLSALPAEWRDLLGAKARH